MPVGWDEYLNVSNACDTFHECCRRCRSAFEQHRRNIQCAVEVTRPKTVPCLGAGALNDIPYEFIVQWGRPSIWWTGSSYRTVLLPHHRLGLLTGAKGGDMQDRDTDDGRAEDISSHRVLQTRTQ